MPSVRSNLSLEAFVTSLITARCGTQLHLTFVVLTVASENEGKQAISRIVSASCQSACRVALHTRPQGRQKRRVKEKSSGTVDPSSPILWIESDQH